MSLGKYFTDVGMKVFHVGFIAVKTLTFSYVIDQRKILVMKNNPQLQSQCNSGSLHFQRVHWKDNVKIFRSSSVFQY